MTFTDTERLLVGAARNQVGMNPENTLFDAKRLTGHHFTDAAIQEDMKHWPSKVVDKGGKPYMQVTCKGR